MHEKWIFHTAHHNFYVNFAPDQDKFLQHICNPSSLKEQRHTSSTRLSKLVFMSRPGIEIQEMLTNDLFLVDYDH